MKEWFTFSKIISMIIISILVFSNTYHLDFVIYLFCSLSFLIFAIALSTYFLLLFKSDKLDGVLKQFYVDVKYHSTIVVQAVYGYGLSKTILEDNVVKMSKRLTEIRECLIENYIKYWWSYLSPNDDFEKLTRVKITKSLELLSERFRDMNYSQLIMIVIRLKVGMSKSKQSTTLKKLSEIDKEKYFASCIYEILPKLLQDENDLNLDELRQFLADVLSVSACIPLLDLVQDPYIIFNSIIALLAQNVTDISQYVEHVRVKRTKFQNPSNKTKSGVTHSPKDSTQCESTINYPTASSNLITIQNTDTSNVVMSNFQDTTSTPTAIFTLDNSDPTELSIATLQPVELPSQQTPSSMSNHKCSLSSWDCPVENIQIVATVKTNESKSSLSMINNTSSSIYSNINSNSAAAIPQASSSSPFNSSNSFTSYVIEFDYVLCSLEGCTLQRVRKQIRRRYREFIHLHSHINDHPDGKGLKGPTSLDQMLQLYNNRSPAKIDHRKDFLENYLCQIVKRRALAQSPIFLSFLGIGSQIFDIESERGNITRVGANAAVKPLNEKIRKKLNVIIDKFTDITRDSSHDDLKSEQLHSAVSTTLLDSCATLDQDVTVLAAPSAESNSTGDAAGSGLQPAPSILVQSSSLGNCACANIDEEVNKLLCGLPKLTNHQNPAYPINSLLEQDTLQNHPLLQGHTSLATTTTTTPTPSAASPSVPPVLYTTKPEIIRTPQPWLLSFRLLAMQYRDHVPIRKWSGSQGPVLTRTAGLHGKYQHIYWRILGIAADAIIEWAFEDLLHASFVADYLQLFQDLLWPPHPEEELVGAMTQEQVQSSNESTPQTDANQSKYEALQRPKKSLAKFAYDVDLELLRFAAAYSITDAIPVIAYLFVDKEQLTDLIDTVLADFQDIPNNRLFLFQLLQILTEEHLFPDVFTK